METANRNAIEMNVNALNTKPNERQASIHPMAVVHPRAVVGKNVCVGPFCVVDEHVKLGNGCQLHNNVTITGYTSVGEDTTFFPGCIIGAVPQDLKYRGGPTTLEIGERNIFREYITAHPGTEVGGGVTRIGDNNLFMGAIHIGHDVIIGSNCILANEVLLAGHVVIEDNVTIGGHTGVHHFTSIGKHAMVGGMTKVTSDVPPFLTVASTRSTRQEVRAVNGVGLKRSNFTEAEILRLKQAYMRMFSRRARSSGIPITDTIQDILAKTDDENVTYLCKFLLRSFECGRRGRYLESLRNNESLNPPKRTTKA